MVKESHVNIIRVFLQFHFIEADRKQFELLKAEVKRLDKLVQVSFIDNLSFIHLG
jgi:hypothetical protein